MPLASTQGHKCTNDCPGLNRAHFVLYARKIDAGGYRDAMEMGNSLVVKVSTGGVCDGSTGAACVR